MNHKQEAQKSIRKEIVSHLKEKRGTIRRYVKDIYKEKKENQKEITKVREEIGTLTELIAYEPSNPTEETARENAINKGYGYASHMPENSFNRTFSQEEIKTRIVNSMQSKWSSLVKRSLYLQAVLDIQTDALSEVIDLEQKYGLR